jgi:hypothetical protein
VYRVAYGPNPFEPRAWAAATADGTFGNRFDDPGSARNAARFRTLYCASTAAGAFGETLARFRPSLALLTLAQAVVDEEPIDEDLLAGEIPSDWRNKRRLGSVVLDDGLSFVDIANGESLACLRTMLAPVAQALGLSELDLSVVTSQQRRLTQAAARLVTSRPLPTAAQLSLAFVTSRG